MTEEKVGKVEGVEAEETRPEDTPKSVEDKVNKVVSALDELRTQVTELIEAVRSSMSLSEGVKEVMRANADALNRVAQLLEKMQTPEQANIDAENERKKKPKEAEPARGSEDASSIAEPKNVQRQPDYLSKGAVTPRPEVEVIKDNSVGEFDSIVTKALKGEAKISEIIDMDKKFRKLGGWL